MRKNLTLIENETVIERKQGDDKQSAEQHREALVKELSKAVGSWYVRKDGKYYDVDKLNVKLSLDDVQHACLHRISEDYGKEATDREVLKEVFRRTMTAKHFEREQMVPVWSGATVCQPGTGERYPRSNAALVDVLIGGQYGSEGKGNIVGHISPEYDLLVRVGGPNAGHQVYAEPKPEKYYHLPSGTLRAPNAKLLLGPGAVI